MKNPKVEMTVPPDASCMKVEFVHPWQVEPLLELVSYSVTFFYIFSISTNFLIYT